MMSRNDDDQFDTWEEIENAIARQALKRLADEMLDVDLAAIRACEFAADAVNVICASLGGNEHYIPKNPIHHREARNVQMRINFNGVCKDSARDVGLSVRHVRRIVVDKK
jgi:Mor family transcriptional regulator